MQRPLRLITALGTNKNLILELIDFFNGGDRFQYSEEAKAIRNRFSGRRVLELHLVCTEGVSQVLADLQSSIRDEYPELVIQPIHLPCDDIACRNNDEELRELVYGTVRGLAADDLIIASAGRKTITNRLIEAGLLHGCMGYLTITAPDERAPDIRQRSMKFNVLWISTRQFSEERRERVIKDELGDNFRSLYLLPANVVDRLRNESIGVEPGKGEEDLAWLRKLPKADLHCHLGGAFDADLLKELAAILLNDLGIPAETQDSLRLALEKELNCSLAQLAPSHLFSMGAQNACHCLAGLRPLFEKFPQENAHRLTAILVNALSTSQIASLCWHEPQANGNLLDWYMRCGDLGGSSLLQSEKTLRRALRWLMEQSLAENARFLEVRFSPDNYTRAGLSIPQVIEALLDEARAFMALHPGFQVNFLIMATRHKEKAAMDAHVAAAVTFARTDGGSGPVITGFDLAGQEEGNEPVRFQENFMPLHRHFVNITIHAGEMAEDDKIWQALYLLHAKRIGHGLKLIKNGKMMGYVRDYGIAIEMCPSSNIQTNGFRRFDRPGETGERYPLHEYLKRGIAVTINTDNRGISRTTLSNEYLRAAQLTEGGLSRWEILRLVKNGFKAAFLPKDQKDELLKEIDAEVFRLILDEFFPENS